MSEISGFDRAQADYDNAEPPEAEYFSACHECGIDMDPDDPDNEGLCENCKIDEMAMETDDANDAIRDHGGEGG